MTKRPFFAALAAVAVSATGVAAEYVPTAENLKARAAFADLGFGVFLHWGLYALPGQGEWYQSSADIDRDEYAKLQGAFNPAAFDAREWVKAIKAGGAKYITFTTRHHEGFSMFATRQNDYNVMRTSFGRDIVRELAAACREEGLLFNLYYSLVDWHLDEYPLGDCPNKKGWDESKADYAKYHAFMKAQLEELLTGYGPIGAIWFDGEWDHNPQTGFDWRFDELYTTIHALQPACLIGNNHHHALFAGEDFQLIENTVRAGQTLDPNFPLETCETMNGNWGYSIKDDRYKSVEELVRLLVRNAARGANLLLNIGPQPDGRLPAVALERLQGVGAWLERYGEAVYATKAGPVFADADVVATRRGKTIFLHFLDARRTAFAFRCEATVGSIATFDGVEVRFTQADGLVAFAPSADSAAPDTIYRVTLK